MEKSINDGINKLQQLYDTAPSGSSFKGDSDTELKGKPSLFNRYTLFSNRGDIINTNLAPAGGIPKQSINQVSGNLNNADSGKTVMQNPDAKAIIDYFKKTDFPVEYDYGDFLYGKYYGKIPNNHMITLRRYAGPIEDNIYSSEINNKLDVARIVTWMGEETGNNLKDIMGMNFGFKWRQETSEVQVKDSEAMNMPSPLDNDILSVFNSTSAGNSASGVLANGDKRNAAGGGTDYDAWEVEGFYQNRVFGPVDVIDNMMVRDRGLEFTQSMTISAEFSLKGYGSISPRDAMLDVIGNILAFSYANAPFWGGAVRVREDLRFNKLMGDSGLLKSGDFIGYFGSLLGDIGDKVQNIFSGGLVEGVKSLAMNTAATGANKMMDKYQMRRKFQTVKALLSGEATGEWHITVGNPLRPIAVIGNMILKDTVLEFNNELGLEDFPTSIKATFTFEPARPRDITDIESMFNAGRGRMYLPGEQASTILDASTIKKNYYLAGNTDPSTTSTADLASQKAKLDSAVGSFDSNDRFAKWSDNPGKIANALAFHPVIARMTPKEKGA